MVKVTYKETLDFEAELGRDRVIELLTLVFPNLDLDAQSDGALASLLNSAVQSEDDASDVLRDEITEEASETDSGLHDFQAEL